MSDKELIEKLKEQNKIVKNCNIEGINIYETKRYNKTIYNAEVKKNNASFPKAITTLKLN